MAKRKKTLIDGEIHIVDTDLKLADIVSPEVISVVTQDGLIHRSEFTQVPIPKGFETNLSGINRG
ncbi:MAG: hypothetical protein M3255_01550 [Pseudomonadota bacterium]|nr:hypothetical protein [Pseudomonadota bacterium]